MQNQFLPQPISDPVRAEQLRISFARKNERKSLILTGLVVGSTIMAYLIVQIAIVIFLMIIGKQGLLSENSIYQNTLNTLIVHFASMLLPFSLMYLILKKNYQGRPLVPLQKVGFMPMIAWVGLGMAGCVLANYFTNFIIILVEKLGYKLTQGDMIKPENGLACVILVVSTAIVPGIIEEFAMRCCTLGALQKYGKGFAVFTVSVVFGLIHGNVIQFIFAFTLGAMFGYITIRTGSVLPAMIIHACNNGMSVLRDIVGHYAGESIADTCIVIVFLAWAVLGFFGLIYLSVKKQLFVPKSERQPRSPKSLSFFERLLCLIPGFILPFIFLIFTTITTIEKI